MGRKGRGGGEGAITGEGEEGSGDGQGEEEGEDSREEDGDDEGEGEGEERSGDGKVDVRDFLRSGSSERRELMEHLLAEVEEGGEGGLRMKGSPKERPLAVVVVVVVEVKTGAL